MRILPILKDDPRHISKRRMWFKWVDPNGNNLVSLSEFHKAVRDVIKLPTLFNSKAVMNRSFKQAKKSNDINDFVKNSLVNNLMNKVNIEEIDYQKLSLRIPAGSSFCEQLFRDKLFKQCSNGSD